MTNAIGIIGATGFVGRELMNAFPGAEGFHTKNIDQIVGKSYDVLIVSAPSSNKLLANRRPDLDKLSITQLIQQLQKVNANKVIVVSTVSCIDQIEKLQPYGRHRNELNDFLSSRFKTDILYLPAVYGSGMTKGYFRDQEHYAPLYLLGDIEESLKPWYIWNPTFELWEWNGEESEELRRALEQLAISPKNFWKEPPIEAISVEEVVEMVKSKLMS